MNWRPILFWLGLVAGCAVLSMFFDPLAMAVATTYLYACLAVAGRVGL